jgi:hypothetical protein
MLPEPCPTAEKSPFRFLVYVPAVILIVTALVVNVSRPSSSTASEAAQHTHTKQPVVKTIELSSVRR